MKPRILNMPALVLACGTIFVSTPGAWADHPGKWDPVANWTSDPIHLILLKNGKVLGIEWSGIFGGVNPCILFDPITGDITPFNGPTSPVHDLFCSGHSALPDGRILFVGGVNDVADGTVQATVYDPDQHSWIEQADNPAARFYPTCTTLGDGTVLVMAGMLDPNDPGPNTPAIFNPKALMPQQRWRSLTGAEYCGHDLDDPDPNCQTNNFHLHNYPFMFLLPSGLVAYTGSDDGGEPLDSSLGTRTLDPAAAQGTGVWTDVVDANGDPINDPIRGGSAVMYRPDRIMKAGGRETTSGPALASVYTLDAAAANPSWTLRTSMNKARANHYLVVLPDGEILAVGGTVSGSGDPSPGVFEPELYDPENPSAGWKLMATLDKRLGYHSVVVLLPDARVLATGEDLNGAWIFSPPYLIEHVEDGDLRVKPRPTIQSAPSTIRYGSRFQVISPDATAITKVNLIRLGAATHAFDFDQRFMELSFELDDLNDTVLWVDAPLKGDEAPPGYYMLFILGWDVPSTAKILKLKQEVILAE